MKLLLLSLIILQEGEKVLSNDKVAVETLSERLTIGEWVGVVTIMMTIITGIFWLVFRTGSTYRMILEMKPHVDTIPHIKTKVDILWQGYLTQSNSPMQLNDVGKKGIKKFQYH